MLKNSTKEAIWDRCRVLFDDAIHGSQTIPQAKEYFLQWLREIKLDVQAEETYGEAYDIGIQMWDAMIKLVTQSVYYVSAKNIL